jgi:hypothetical protein
MKKLLGQFSATSVQEMIDALKDLVSDPETTYVTINSDSIRLNLIEETLTDGSKVYNIELTEVSK